MAAPISLSIQIHDASPDISSTIHNKDIIKAVLKTLIKLSKPPLKANVGSIKGKGKGKHIALLKMAEKEPTILTINGKVGLPALLQPPLLQVPSPLQAQVGSHFSLFSFINFIFLNYFLPLLFYFISDSRHVSLPHYNSLFALVSYSNSLLCFDSSSHKGLLTVFAGMFLFDIIMF